MFGQHRDEGWMGGKATDALASPVSLYVVIDDPMATTSAPRRPEIVRELVDMGEYSARDLEGNLWSFATYDPYAHG